MFGFRNFVRIEKFGASESLMDSGPKAGLLLGCVELEGFEGPASDLAEGVGIGAVDTICCRRKNIAVKLYHLEKYGLYLEVRKISNVLQFDG